MRASSFKIQISGDVIAYVKWFANIPHVFRCQTVVVPIKSTVPEVFSSTTHVVKSAFVYWTKTGFINIQTAECKLHFSN